MKQITAFVNQYQSQLLYSIAMRNTMGGRRYETTNYDIAMSMYNKVSKIPDSCPCMAQHGDTYCIEW